MSAFDSSIATFHNDQYTITTSLAEHHIIVKIVNNVSYVCYEDAFERDAFRGNLSSIGLPAVFKLLNKCFAAFVEPPDAKSDSDYVVDVQLSNQSGYIVFDCQCLVDGFLDVDFVLMLKEKVGEDGGETTTQLVAELNRQKQLVADLTAQVCKMERETADSIARLQQTIDAMVERMAGIERNHADSSARMTDR
jgi:hypothetical protein